MFFTEFDVSRKFTVLSSGAEVLRTTAFGQSFDSMFTAKTGPTGLGYLKDIAIVTVLREEYDAMLAQLDSHRFEPGNHLNPNLFAWEHGIITSQKGEYKITVAFAGQPGNLSGFAATLRTVEKWRPRYVLLVGIAGGLLPENKLSKGDVVVSSIIRGYEYGKLGKQFTPRDDLTYHVDGPLLKCALSLAPDWARAVECAPPVAIAPPKACQGEIASGDKVVDDMDNKFFAQVLDHWPRCAAVEMEGAGAACAIQEAQQNGFNAGFLMIRGISDIPRKPGAPVVDASSQTHTQERDVWKRYASATAAAFVGSLIRNRWPIGPL